MLNKDWGKSRIPHSRMTKTCKEILVTFTETHAASHKKPFAPSAVGIEL